MTKAKILNTEVLNVRCHASTITTTNKTYKLEIAEGHTAILIRTQEDWLAHTRHSFTFECSCGQRHQHSALVTTKQILQVHAEIAEMEGK